MSDFVMPSLGADMESGRLVSWLIEPGSKVKRGDVVAVIETHKGAIEVEIFEEGVISELCAEEGKEVPVGGLLARLTPTAERAAPPPARAPAPPKKPRAPPVRAEKLVPPRRPPPAAAAEHERPAAVQVRVTPVARRRAAELGIDPGTLKGTGIDDSVTLADVELARPAAAAPKPAPEPRAARPGFDPALMRQAIAAAMSRSKREIPHYYLTSTVDLGRAIGWLETFNRDRPPDERFLPAVLLLKATALALRNAPQLNGFWEGGRFRPGPGIHVGWAISLRGGGLVAPAIHDADQKPIVELMTALRDLVARARTGGLRSSELMDPTITVTSLGERGADSVIGIIYPPQVAIVGFGRIAERPWVVDGRLDKRPLVALSLSADHRASDGHTGGKLLAAIDQLLQNPDEL